MGGEEEASNHGSEVALDNQASLSLYAQYFLLKILCITRPEPAGFVYKSCGSDFHGPENPWLRLGQLPELPVGCKPVWESDCWPLH